jgi:hypothetical protein
VADVGHATRSERGEGIGSLSEVLPPEQARRLASGLELYNTSKHGRRLRIAAIDLWALPLRCLDWRILALQMRQGET